MSIKDKIRALPNNAIYRPISEGVRHDKIHPIDLKGLADSHDRLTAALKRVMVAARDDSPDMWQEIEDAITEAEKL